MIGRNQWRAAPGRRSPPTGSAAGAATGFTTSFIEAWVPQQGPGSKLRTARTRSNPGGSHCVWWSVDASAQAEPRGPRVAGCPARAAPRLACGPRGCDARGHAAAALRIAGLRVIEDSARDARLVAALADGDRGALGELYDRFAAQMLGLATRILGNRRDGEDLVHDVFLEAWQRARSYDPARGSVRAWLLLRVRSRAIDRARALASARRFAMVETAAGSDTRAEPEPGLGGDRERARAALEALPEAQRRVVELCYFEGCSGRDVAERLGIPIGTVKSRLFAAMKGLRAAFDAGGGR